MAYVILIDYKTQNELLQIQDLTLAMAIEKVRAAEDVNREILRFPVVEADTLIQKCTINRKTFVAGWYDGDLYGE